MSLFLYNDYRKFITNYISERPNKGRGEISKMAVALSVHQTLISLVLSGERDFNLEQGYALADYLELTELESDYLSLLIQFARAGTLRYKSAVRSKLDKIKLEATQLSKRVEKEKVLTEQQRAVIYSSWVYSAIRIFTSVGDRGKSVEDIQQHFHLQRPQIVEILNFLEQAGLVIKEKNHYKMGPQRTFLEHGSPHLIKHHSNWRIKALNQASQITEKELMFTSPVSVSQEDFEKLREQIADLIKKFLVVVKDSPAEDLACLNIDFFWVRS